MKSPSRKLLFAAGIALGLAQLSRYSAVLLYPIFLILALLEGFWSKKNFKISSSLVLIFALSVVTIWAGYGFRMKPFLAETINQQEKIEFVKNSAARFLPFWNKNLANKTEIFLKQTPMPLTTYITGFLGVMKHDKEGHLMFFWGKWSDYGNPLYYVLALLIKTPIALIIFFFAAFFSIPLKRLKKDEIYLILPISIIFIIASASKLQLGIRYILPIYPLIAIFSSRIILFVKNSWQRLIIVILTGWLIFTGVFAWPHYLSYFNEFIGGSDNGYKYLRDSNIDWGQDLPALGQYAKKNGTPTITLFYFGQDNPAMYGINFINFTKSEYIKPEKKIYAISVQYLDSVAWTKIYPPCAKAGYSIFIYDFRPPPGIK
jgi:4-amino-4-deoxy-L-arabinose transferase-like glycosyltransferase